MLTKESTESGCMAYYLWEKTQVPTREQERNLLRNYRRGILLAFQIKKLGFEPADILELGPGSGYFSSGIRYVFPDARITVVDIVDEVISGNLNIHRFEGIKGSPDNLTSLVNRKFDLIIARDILEHVSDIGIVIRNISELLKENGLFHFLTPNGHEDVWKHYVNWRISEEPSELLINHVNYFEGKGLLEFLGQHNLYPLKYYTYQVKTTFKGQGWSLNRLQAATPSVNRSASMIINEFKNDNDQPVFNKKDILDQWYLRTRLKWLTFLYCHYMHQPLLKINPVWNIGHEIFGLFIRKS